jgi:integration host factor subunit alpha
MPDEATLTKALIVERVHERIGITKKEASGLVDEVFEIMRDTLALGHKVKISGFGNFVVDDKHARRGLNPQTGADIVIPRRRVVRFEYSRKLKETLNDEES